MEYIKRYRSVDGLKYILILLVVTCHYYNSLAFTDENLPQFIGSIFFFHYSHLAVEIFFMISGFFMIRSLYQKETSFTSFLLQRIKRFYPLAIFSSCIILFVGILSTFFTHAIGQKYTIWTIFLSLTGITRWLSTTEPIYNGPLWYIQVLLLCEIILYCTYYYVKKPFFLGASVFIMFINLGLKILNLDIPFFNESIARGIFNYFLGVILYQFTMSTNINWKYISSFFVAVSIIIIFIGIIENSTKHIGNLQLCVSFIISPACLLSCIYIKTINRLFALFAYFGKATYSILSTHMIIIYIIRIIKYIGFNIDTSNTLSYLLYLFISTLTGIVFYEIIEKHFLPSVLIGIKSKLLVSPDGFKSH